MGEESIFSKEGEAYMNKVGNFFDEIAAIKAKETKRVTIIMPVGTHDALLKAAAEEQMRTGKTVTVSRVIRQMIDAGLAGNGGE